MFNLSTMANLISSQPRRSRTSRTPTPTTTPTTTTPETDSETPPTKPTDHHHLPLNQHFNYNNPHNNHSKIILSFTNGGLKRHHPKTPTLPLPPVVVVYKECLKNHAASLGGHALDGCGEFMPSPTSTAAAINNNNPTSLKCAACGCHRNFHRREPDIDEYPLPQNLQLTAPPVPHLQGRERSPNSSVSPPPISSAYYPSSAPHMLLALSAGNLSSGPLSDHYPQQEQYHHQNRTGNTTTTTAVTTTPAAGTKYSNGGGGSSRKRFRTKFSEEQKCKMHNFSDKLGWKLQKRDDNLIAEFCNEIGVGRSVLKVWMHNNKNTLGKANLSNSISNINLHTTNNTNSNNYNDSTSPSNNHNHHYQVHHHQHSGSSSSN
ncbi:hypothetical protein MKX01_033479 [Papaver californicum]|nr:hypothetical protein MKX01_033479 [Papaver californicum]